MKSVCKHILPAFIVVILTSSVIAQVPDDRKLLAPSWPLETLDQVILPRDEWHPFPTYSDPAGFEEIPIRVQQAHIDRGEELLNTEWEPLPATVFLEYVRTGNRSHFQDLQFGHREKLADLVLAEVFERKGRYMDQIVNGIWTICEESFWGVPAHLHLQEEGYGLPDVTEPVVDLFAAETAVLLSWIHYLMKPQLDEIDPLIAERIVYETDRRVLTPFLERRDWGWMGFQWRENPDEHRRVNNWNPWINSNIITAGLLLESDPERRLRIVHKSMASVDNFFLPYPADGGCDEGPSYWNRAGGSLYDCLELLHSASDGKIDIFDQPLIQKMGTYISKAYISDPYFINFADASAKMHISPPLVYRYGEAIGDKTMMQFAAFTAKQTGFGEDRLEGRFGVLNRALPALFTIEKLEQTKASEPFIRDVWLEDIEVMAARSQQGGDDGWYIAAKGGHNAESHNHNDIGNFIAYFNGKPVLIDAGAQTYTAKTFSSQRYELWNNQSAYHNVPTINGVMQHEGRQYEAKNVNYKQNNRKAVLAMDLAACYPEDARVESWERSIILNRGKNVEIQDDYVLSEYIAPNRLHFLTPHKSSESAPGIVLLQDTETGEDFMLRYNAAMFSPTFETITIEDARMSSSWGDRLYRVTLEYRSGDAKNQSTILLSH
ncbi:MAG: heparinase [Candidatus Marinimicrobia bacterium]|nr:heparinase [Candidatus Neomarinimicrobiota bacterium]